MRLATLIVSVVLMLIAGIQSCAVALGGSAAESLSTAAHDKQQAKDIAGAGSAGVFAVLLWLVAAAFVMSKPRVSMWLFGGAALILLGAGAGGFTDAFIWAVASAIFAVMSWRGVTEKEKDESQKQMRYQADVAMAAGRLQAPQAQAAPPPGWYDNPQGVGQRYWDGQRWTEHVQSQQA